MIRGTREDADQAPKVTPAERRRRPQARNFLAPRCVSTRNPSPGSPSCPPLGGKVRFVGFALDSAEALKRYLAETPCTYELVPDSQEIAKAFGVDSFPRHMVLDRGGKIVWLSGRDDDRIERLRAMIVRVLASEVK